VQHRGRGALTSGPGSERVLARVRSASRGLALSRRARNGRGAGAHRVQRLVRRGGFGVGAHARSLHGVGRSGLGAAGVHAARRGPGGEAGASVLGARRGAARWLWRRLGRAGERGGEKREKGEGEAARWGPCAEMGEGDFPVAARVRGRGRGRLGVLGRVGQFGQLG
jgi:hypothetical protein